LKIKDTFIYRFAKNFIVFYEEFENLDKQALVIKLIFVSNK